MYTQMWVRRQATRPADLAVYCFLSYETPAFSSCTPSIFKRTAGRWRRVGDSFFFFLPHHSFVLVARSERIVVQREVLFFSEVKSLKIERSKLAELFVFL